MSHNVIGLHSCRGCQAPIPANDRRRRYCDDCRPAAAARGARVHRDDVDASSAGRAPGCQCKRPMLYDDFGETRCHTCGHEAGLARAA